VANDDSKLEAQTDEELLRLHRRGDPRAFEVLVHRRAGELYRFLNRFLGDRSQADDVLQETFLQVHLSADRFDTARRFKPWLFTIAANKARDAMRSHSRKRTAELNAQVSESDEESVSYIDLLAANIDLPIEELQNRELRRAVQKLVMDMPEHLREVLLLGYFQQMPYKDIAEALGVPLGTVKSRLHAAVSYFARRWESIGKQFEHE
jgi:RNA polymerase sigma-70 factor, ECF subfamily